MRLSPSVSHQTWDTNENTRANTPKTSDGALTPAPPVRGPASHGLQLLVVHDVHPRVGTPSGLAARHVGDAWHPAIILVLAFSIWLTPSATSETSCKGRGGAPTTSTTLEANGKDVGDTSQTGLTKYRHIFDTGRPSLEKRKYQRCTSIIKYRVHLISQQTVALLLITRSISPSEPPPKHP